MTATSPEDVIRQFAAFIRKNDKKAYTHMSEEKLLEHLRYSVYTGQLCGRFTPEGELIALATWNIDPSKSTVFLVGIVGDKDFLRYMLSMWRDQFPYYALRYLRNGKMRKRENNKTLIYT